MGFLKKITVLIIGGLLLPLAGATAQAVPEVIFTWQVNNFFPSDYPGKAWPTPNSNLTVSLEVIQNNKILDLAQEEFYWYLDNKLTYRGFGLKTVNFKITNYEGRNHFVFVMIKRTNGEQLESAVQVPIFKPRIILENDRRSLSWPAETTVQAMIIPYFFNIANLTELNFEWRVNNQQQNNNNYQLLINTSRPPAAAEKTQIFLEISVENKANPFEFLKEVFKITIY